MHWYQYTKTQIENEFEVDITKGLSSKEVEKRLLKYGPNILPESDTEGWLSIFFRQFQSPLIYILLVCSVIVYYLRDHTDSIIILVVLIFNAILGTVQEGRSQRALLSLKKLSDSDAGVVRDGKEEVVGEKNIVPGDVLVLQEGQKVVADARIIHFSNLSVDEAAMTGESGAVLKTDAVLSEQNLPSSGQKNMVFKGTSILTGNGLAIVVGTGVNTQIGVLSRALLEPEEEIPLQRNIKRLSKIIIGAVLLICLALFNLGLILGRQGSEMFSIVVSMAISMVPEGLPLVLTLILVSGVWRMSKKNALVKKMQAVEALGQAKILAVDKTGTLTRNEMVVKKLYVDNRIYTITGSGYDPKGAALLNGDPQSLLGDLSLAGIIASLGSRATVRFSEKEGVYRISGDPTEAAMAVLGEKLGNAREKLLEKYHEIAEIAFDYKNKFRAVFYEQSGDGVFCAIAGAPETIIHKAGHFLEHGQAKKLEPHHKKNLEAAVEEFTKQGLRVVAFGFKHLTRSHPFDNIDDMVFGGFFAIEDSLRPEAPGAIKRALAAGIKVVMITGDHKLTATAIAHEAGIYSPGDEVITGSDLLQLTEAQLAAKLHKVSVFARVTPEDKMKIIRAYKHAGLVVAMTGDGVNDAPSLVAADLGVAMGKIGTEVAKEASDIVLLDDNLNSILSAVGEGRNMYRTIQKALLFLFSTSMGELFTITAALFLGLPTPIAAVQILWLNLVTDPLIGTSLALDKKDSHLLDSKPGKLPEYFITGEMFFRMILIAATMAVGTLFLFNMHDELNYAKAITISLTVLAVFQWYNSFNCRQFGASVFSKDIFTNHYLLLGVAINFGLQICAVYTPALQKVLKTVPLSLNDWLMIFAVGFSVIIVEEFRKLAFRLFRKKAI